jgi:hypothetical protein
MVGERLDWDFSFDEITAALMRLSNPPQDVRVSRRDYRRTTLMSVQPPPLSPVQTGVLVWASGLFFAPISLARS